MSHFYFVQQHFIRFLEIFSPFGMSDDAKVDIHGTEHGRRNFTGISAGFILAHILGPDENRVIRRDIACHFKKYIWRAKDHVHIFRFALLVK